MTPTGGTRLKAARGGDSSKFRPTKREKGFIILNRAKCCVDPLYPPSTRGDSDDLADRATIGKTRGQERLRPSVTVKSDEEAAVPIETDRLIIEAQFRRRNRHPAHKGPALLCFALEDDGGIVGGGWSARRRYTEKYQQEPHGP